MYNASHKISYEFQYLPTSEAVARCVAEAFAAWKRGARFLSLWYSQRPFLEDLCDQGSQRATSKGAEHSHSITINCEDKLGATCLLGARAHMAQGWY